jgi:hypothetical protein
MTHSDGASLPQWSVPPNRDYSRLQCWSRALVRLRNKHYESVLGAGAKAKSVINNLPLLSVLAIALYSFNRMWSNH